MSLQVDFKLFVLAFPLGSLLGVEGDESHWTFAPFGVSASYDGSLQDIGMSDQFLLDGQARRVLDPRIREFQAGGLHNTPHPQR